jgi:hypothetical protein
MPSKKSQAIERLGKVSDGYSRHCRNTEGSYFRKRSMKVVLGNRKSSAAWVMFPEVTRIASRTQAAS